MSCAQFKNIAGFSLLELLACLALVGLLSAMAFQSLTAWRAGLHRLERRVQEREEIERIEAIFSTLCRDSRSHFNVLPITIGTEEVQDFNGKRINAGRPLAPEQSTLTFAERTVDEILIRSNSGVGHFCALSPLSAAQRQFIAIAPTGLMPIRAGQHRPETACSLDLNCPCRIDLSSITTGSRTESEIMGLVPVRDIFTLYLDRTNILRRLSQLTGEDQPIAYGISGFAATQEADFTRRFLLIRLTIADNKRSETYRCDLGPLPEHPYESIF